MNFGLSFLGKIAKKHPALARFYEEVIVSSILLSIVGVIGLLISYFETGESVELMTGLYTLSVAFVVSILKGLYTSISMYMRRRNEKNSDR